MCRSTLVHSLSALVSLVVGDDDRPFGSVLAD